MDRTPEEEAEVQAMQDEILKPPPSAWSDEPPMNGWYWKGWRDTPDRYVVVHVSDGEWSDMNGDTGRTDDHTGVRWQPVAPPLAMFDPSCNSAMQRMGFGGCEKPVDKADG